MFHLNTIFYCDILKTIILIFIIMTTSKTTYQSSMSYSTTRKFHKLVTQHEILSSQSSAAEDFGFSRWDTDSNWVAFNVITIMIKALRSFNSLGTPTQWHSVTSQKNRILSAGTIRTSNLAKLHKCEISGPHSASAEDSYFLRCHIPENFHVLKSWLGPYI